jgi:hypothetical protein
LAGDLEQNLKQARQILKKKTEVCHGLLERLADRIAAHKFDDPAAEFERGVQGVLRVVGRGLFEATAPFLGQNSFKEVDFYFWPGYVSISDLQRPRVTLTCDHLGIPCGIGFRVIPALKRENSYLRYEASEASLWFSRLLVAKDKCGLLPLPRREKDRVLVGEDEVGRFSPGGTHPWIMQGAFLPKLRTDGTALDVLAIQVGAPEEEPANGVLSVSLDENHVECWGHQVAQILNNSAILKCQAGAVWPYGADSSAVTPLSVEVRTCIQRTRETLYSIWLASNFVPDWRHRCRSWIDEFLTRLRDTGQPTIPTLADGIQHWLQTNDEVEFHRYRCWYTISLTQTVPLPETDVSEPELGSAMVLTSRPLEWAYLLLIQRWIETIYLQIRNLDNTIQMKKIGQEEERRAFAHKTLSHLQSLEQQLRLMGVYSHRKGGFARNLLTVLIATVSRFRRTPHKPSTVFELGQDDPILSYLNISAAGALQRGQEAKPVAKPGGHYNDAYSEHPCYHMATRLILAPDPVAALKDELQPQMNALPSGAEEVVQTQSFGVMFIHCLSQALYHSLRWKAENPEAPFRHPDIKFSWDGTMLRCQILNPGDPPHEAWRGSKDARELKDLAQYFMPAGIVWGPMFSTEDEAWATGFAIPSTYRV